MILTNVAPVSESAMKCITATLNVPDSKVARVKEALEKDLHILQQSLRLRETGSIRVDADNPIHSAIFLNPDAIREHVADDEEMDERVKQIPDEMLFDVAAEFLVDSDHVWEEFDDWCREIVQMAEHRILKNTCDKGRS